MMRPDYQGQMLNAGALGGHCTPTGGASLSQKLGSGLVSAAVEAGAFLTSKAVLRTPWGMSACQLRPTPLSSITLKPAGRHPPGFPDCERVQAGLRDPPPVHEWHALDL
ncbi:unnamed protein product [Pipistrellus nathusii]|uniref:Uncharacterized protein n=1 Tax=Pipistrellus nathusii TaxID=59473 RepID=A0ABP0AM61_PIPNA